MLWGHGLGGWNLGPVAWNNSVGLGWGSGRSGDFPRGATVSLWTFLSSLGGGTSQGCWWTSLGTVHLPVSLDDTGWEHALGGGLRGLSMPFPQCPGLAASEAGSGVGLKPRSGMTWARLISSLNCCRQKDIFSFSLTFFFSLSLLLPIIEHSEGYF